MNVDKIMEYAEKLDYFSQKFNAFLFRYIKRMIPRLISASILGFILKYILDAKGLGYMIIALAIMLVLKGGGDSNATKKHGNNK